jgi:hypothetical protein
MPLFLVRLGQRITTTLQGSFEIDAATADDAREQAKKMIEKNYDDLPTIIDDIDGEIDKEQYEESVLIHSITFSIDQNQLTLF